MTKPIERPLPPRAYVAFDDTDTLTADRGTGKLARWFGDRLPEDVALWGVVRVQLPVLPGIPFTSHNSAAVVVLERTSQSFGAQRDGAPAWERELIDELALRARQHVEELALPGSDPGVCVAWDGCPALAPLMEFGQRAAVAVVDQAQAKAAATRAHLSGHGGTCDGIIGAAAGVGLVSGGWGGRLIEYRWNGLGLRDVPDPVSVAELHAAGIRVVALDRDAPLPAPHHRIHHGNWLRPRFWAGRPVLPVLRHTAGSDDAWVIVGPRSRGSTRPTLEE